MDDKQFSIGLKISITVACILLILIGILVVNTIKSKDNTSSVLEEVSNIDSALSEADMEEIKQYLDVYSLLVQEENPTTTENLETIISFLNTIFWYEPVSIGENLMAGYEKNVVQTVAIELLGTTNIPTSEDLILDNENNVYRYALGGEFMSGKCMNIKDISMNNNIYEITYESTFPGENEAYEMAEGKEVELNTYTIKIKLEKNKNYEYSKYCLKNIELLSKDIVKYN